jgi:endonuclease/exonuclease/phosphatase (EEP) superfamily protein YafD
MESKTKEPTHPRLRRLLYWAIILQLAGTAVFVAALLLGERSRLSLIFLYLPRQPLLVLAVLGAALAPLTKQAKRRVRVLAAVEVVTALVLLFPVMGFRLGSTGKSDFPVRLATYNVYFGKLSRPALLDEIAAMPADIILLQATYDSMSARVKERFPDRSMHHTDDFLLITRYKITSVEEPPPLSDGALPKFVEYVLETDAGPLRVFNVHPFSPRHALFEDEQTNDNIRHREEQIAAVIAAAHRPGPPFVIAGDTNLPALSSMSRRYFADLHDAFDDVGFGLGYTFPAKRPWMRIDRALAKDGIRFVDVRVGKLGASDHRPVFVDFDVESHR